MSENDVEPKTLALAKGDEVWHVSTQHWAGAVELEVKHGVITGGGDYQVLVTWDGHKRPERFSRYQVQKWWSDTKLEALQRARRGLAEKHIRAIREADATTQAIIEVQALLDAESGMAVK